MIPHTVSIVIPVYNEEKYIKECLESIFGQTEKPDEVIVVDNNCTDNTIGLAKQYDIRVIVEKHQGMIPARNAGFNAAQKDIIVKIDADSRPIRQAVSDIKKAFHDPQVAAVSSHLLLYDFGSVGKTLIPSRIVHSIAKNGIGQEVLFGPQYALKRDVWNSIRTEICEKDAQVHEDLDIALHAKKYGKILFLEKPLVVTSARRATTTPLKFFVEYPARILKMRRIHHV